MDSLLNILESVLGRSRKTSRENYAFFSPFTSHRKPKLQVNLDTSEDESGRPINEWHCWITEKRGKSIYSLFNQPEIKQRLSESSRKRLDEYFKNQKFNIFIRSQKTDKKYVQEEILPKEYKVFNETKTLDARIALRYLINDRKITEQDIVKYQIGYCTEGKYRDRIIIPSFDENHNLNYFIARDFKDKHTLKYLNPKRDANIVGFESFINWREPITIVEGIFDAIAVKRNAIPLMGKSISEELKYKLYLNDVQDVYLALDGDALKDAIGIAEYLMNNDIKVYRVNLQDSDPSELGFLKFNELKRESKLLDFKELMKIKLGL